MAKKHTVSETNETISAVITALGEGAVGIIRISGHQLWWSSISYYGSGQKR